MTAEKWRVKVQKELLWVTVAAVKGRWVYLTGKMIFIEPPNLIERLLGVSCEDKIRKAIRACEKYCNKHNKKEALCAGAVEKCMESIKGELPVEDG